MDNHMLSRIAEKWNLTSNGFLHGYLNPNFFCAIKPILSVCSM